MTKYLILQCSIWEDEVHLHILHEDITDIKQAEKLRLDYIRQRPRLNPQMIKVLQYTTNDSES